MMLTRIILFIFIGLKVTQGTVISVSSCEQFAALKNLSTTQPILTYTQVNGNNGDLDELFNFTFNKTNHWQYYSYAKLTGTMDTAENIQVLYKNILINIPTDKQDSILFLANFAINVLKRSEKIGPTLRDVKVGNRTLSQLWNSVPKEIEEIKIFVENLESNKFDQYFMENLANIDKIRLFHCTDECRFKKFAKTLPSVLTYYKEP